MHTDTSHSIVRIVTLGVCSICHASALHLAEIVIQDPHRTDTLHICPRCAGEVATLFDKPGREMYQGIVGAAE